MRRRRFYGAPVAAMGHRLYNFTSGSLPPGATLTRASTGWYFDSAGVLQSAANDVARFNYNPSTLALEGLLNEPARTNSIRNSTAGGAVAGSPGTLPTNWITSLISGVSREVVGVGTVDGVNYTDIRLFGTPVSSINSVIAPETATQIAASVGQTWALSAYVAIVGGSMTNIGAVAVNISERSGAGTLLGSAGTSAFTPTTASLATQRRSIAALLVQPTVAFVMPQVVIAGVAGQPYDITLRIGLPQIELASEASSPVKTTGAAVARAADVLSLAMTDGTYDIDITRLSGVTNVVGAVVSGGSYTVPTDLSPLQSVVARRVG